MNNVTLSSTLSVVVILVAVSVAAMEEVATLEDDCRPGVVVVPLFRSHAKCTGNVVAEEVLEGKTFSSDEGVEISGTMVNQAAVTITPGASDQNIPEGYHNGSGAVEGDPALTSPNIRTGVTIFGVPGTINPMICGETDYLSYNGSCHTYCETVYSASPGWISPCKTGCSKLTSYVNLNCL